MWSFSGYARGVVVCAVTAFAWGAFSVGEPLRVEVIGEPGAPRLSLDGDPVVPFIFFFNTDIRNERGGELLGSQVSLARAHGVHVYSLPFRIVRQADGVTPDYARALRLLGRFIEEDPEARFLLRLFLGPNWSWSSFRPWGEAKLEEFARYADGSVGRISTASRYSREVTDEELAAVVRYCESSPCADRIIGYQPGLASSEMFHDFYRQRGPDYSAVNHAHFRNWLRKTHGTDAALQRAWRQPAVTLETAEIPRFEPGRYPMRQAGRNERIRVFYDPARERDWVDFSTYASEIMAERIVSWARIIKRETQRRKLAAFFYGYTFELPGSNSGHYALRRVLDCPDVDMLASPYSYRDRAAGGTGQFMSAVDSIGVNGKMWFNEDDTRTSLMDLSQVTSEGFLLGAPAQTLDETVGILTRNLATVLVHRAGTWWMDLTASGAFDHPRPWEALQRLAPVWERSVRDPVPYRPEVGVIVDERAKLVVRDDWTVNAESLYTYRDQAQRTGAAVGYYLLSDFLRGDRVPPCRVYVFPNAFRVDPDEVRSIRQRLRRERAWAVWAYLPGVWREDGIGLERVKALTGIGVEDRSGRVGSHGTGLLTGESWGCDWLLERRPVIASPEVDIVGTYRVDDQPSAALRRHDGWTSVLFGDLGVSAGVLRRVFHEAGVHIWTRDDCIVQTDGRFLMVHAAEPSVREVVLPGGIRAEAIAGRIVDREGTRLRVQLPPGGTAWLLLSEAR